MSRAERPVSRWGAAAQRREKEHLAAGPRTVSQRSADLSSVWKGDWAEGEAGHMLGMTGPF